MLFLLFLRDVCCKFKRVFPLLFPLCLLSLLLLLRFHFYDALLGRGGQSSETCATLIRRLKVPKELLVCDLALKNFNIERVTGDLQVGSEEGDDSLDIANVVLVSRREAPKLILLNADLDFWNKVRVENENVVVYKLDRTLKEE